MHIKQFSGDTKYPPVTKDYREERENGEPDYPPKKNLLPDSWVLPVQVPAPAW